MIVRSAQATLHLVTQPDHAGLARRIMEGWVPLHGAERRQSILLAIEQHDNGWREPDEAPPANPDSGRPYDFINMPATIKQAIWPRGIARLAADDIWAAALVAQHALTIYDRYRSDAEWREFFEGITASRDRLVSESGLTREQLTHDYAFVRIGDLLSLMFCNDWREEQTHGTWRFRVDADRVTVTPDAFSGRELAIAVQARAIPDVRYDSDAALLRAVRQAAPLTLRGVITGAP